MHPASASLHGPTMWSIGPAILRSQRPPGMFTDASLSGRAGAASVAVCLDRGTLEFDSGGLP
ncbi:hypothetical protein [Plantibacter sp. YIM 135249]|uniref:hypothetical protein n=1 Tax=Plantibacter sp. YIM 135249 TaxID=3423918 RepID=UPI003D34C666